MLRLYREGVSVLAVLDSRRAKKSGEYPVKIEVVHNRVQKYYPTGVDMSSSAWKGLSCSHKLPDRHSEIIRQFNRVATEVQSMIDRGSFSMEALDVRLGKTAPLTVDMSLKTMMDNMLKEGRVNSYYRCRSTLKAVARFCPGEITFQMMTPAWFSAFENFLRTENKTVTTINIYMKTLRTVLNEALKEGFIRESGYPFGRGRYVIPGATSRNMALTGDNLHMVMSYSGPANLEKYRDLWLFSYFCNGINFRDMLFLKYKNVIDGEIWFLRAKTVRSGGSPKVIRAVVTPEMLSILQRWGNPPDSGPDTFLFPYARPAMTPMEISNLVRKEVRLCNLALASIASGLGIPKFTTYSARHTYATVLMRKGVNLNYISESLGHSSLLVTEHYLDGADRTDRLRNSRLLTTV